MPDILAIGEVLIDLTQTAQENGIPVYSAFPGGAPANLSVAASRLGASAAFVGKVGQDAFGSFLIQTLNDNHVDTRCVAETADAPTTLAVVSVASDGDRSFSFYRKPGADTLLSPEDIEAAFEQFPDAPKFVHVGSVSMTDEPARSAILTAVKIAKSRGIPVSYDPNYRANLWTSAEAAIPQMKKILPYTDILKLSDEELPLLTGTTDPAEGSQLLADYGISIVLVTLGADGVFYRLRDLTGELPGIPVKVADTNGAGDTFLGAFLAALSTDGRPFREIPAEELHGYIIRANAAAACTCMGSGAIPAMPAPDAVDRMLEGLK